MKGPVTTRVTAAVTSPAVGARSVLQLEPQKIGQMCTGERTGPLLSAKRIPERVVASDPPEDGSRAAAPSATTRPIPAKAWGCASRYCRSAANAAGRSASENPMATARRTSGAILTGLGSCSA